MYTYRLQFTLGRHTNVGVMNGVRKRGGSGAKAPKIANRRTTVSPIFGTRKYSPSFLCSAASVRCHDLKNRYSAAKHVLSPLLFYIPSSIVLFLGAKKSRESVGRNIDFVWRNRAKKSRWEEIRQRLPCKSKFQASKPLWWKTKIILLFLRFFFFAETRGGQYLLDIFIGIRLPTPAHQLLFLFINISCAWAWRGYFFTTSSPPDFMSCVCWLLSLLGGCCNARHTMYSHWLQKRKKKRDILSFSFGDGIHGALCSERGRQKNY